MTTLISKTNDALNGGADVLRSRQFVRVVDLLSEGEISGLVDGLKSVYLNDTPVMNPDGSVNFEGVTLEGRNGTQTQSYIPGFPSVESEINVAVQVKLAQPVVRSITNGNINAVRVTIAIPALQQMDTSSGAMKPYSVAYAIDVQTNGGGFVEKVSDVVSGKSATRYQRDYSIALSGSGPWDVRVRRISADNTSSTTANDTYWSSYTEIIDAKLRYPNSALQAVSVSSEYFNSIPSRSYETKGLLVQVPSNYNPDLRTYAGAWDGTFKRAWTNNPAWCFYDLLSQNRYGLGDYLDVSQIDKWALYRIGRYCDELVPDGFGGFEPRYTCSLYLQSQEEAYNVITSMASIFCGIAFWTGGAVTAVQDAPSQPVALFAPGNVVNGEFSYSGSSLKTRHTVALVSWNDPADMYRQKIEYVEDREGVVRYGVRQTSVVAIGCTSRGQAHRFGRSLLYTGRMETETVGFRVGMDAIAVMPGEVIQTTDPVRAGVRMGGRIKAATASAITLDAPVTLEAGSTYTLWAVLPSGAVESRAVSQGVGQHATLTLVEPFSAAPQELAMWTLAASTLAPETWRVVSIAEVSGQPGQLEISALKFSPNKYAEIEQGIVLDPLPISNIKTRPEAPANVTVSEGTYSVGDGSLGTRATVSWAGEAAFFEVMYRRVGGAWVTLSTSSLSVDIQPITAGVYEFSVVAVSAVGYRSRSVAVTATIYGLDGPPDSVTGLALNLADSGVYAFWHVPYGPDAYNWSSTELREGATWETGKLKFNGKATTANLGWFPAGHRTVWAAHRNAAGEASSPASAAIDIAAPNQPVLTAEVWRNVVTLKWQDCTSSQPISTYLLRVGPLFAQAVEFAQIKATTFDRTEDVAGSYVYWVIPVDVAGNQGAPSNITVTVLPSIDEALDELQEGMQERVQEIVDLGKAVAQEAVARGTDITNVKKLITDGDAALAQQVTTLTARPGNGGNLIDNSEFASGLTGWTFTQTVANRMNFSRTTNPAYIVGNGTAQIDETGYAPSATDYGEAATGDLPVIAGRRYQFSVFTGAHRCYVYAFIYWYNAAGGVVSASALSGNLNELEGGSSLATYKRLGVFGVAPTGAVSARAVVRKHTTLATRVNSYCFFTKPMFCGASTEQTVFDEYAPGAAYSVNAAAVAIVASAQATTAGKLDASYTFAVTAGKRVAGMRAQATSTESSLVFLAERVAFAIGDSDAAKPLLTLGNVNGVASMGLSGDMYVDGTIKGRAFEAETITGDKIKANAILVKHLDATTISALAVNVGVGKNLLPNSTFVQGSSGWWSFNENGQSTPMLDGAAPDWIPVGGHTLAVQQVGANSGESGWVSVYMPVTAGKRYEFSVYCGSHRALVYSLIAFYDAAGNYLLTTNSTVNDMEMSGGKSLSGYKRIFGFATAPANAAAAVYQLRKAATKAGIGATDSWAMFTQPFVGEAGASQTAPSVYGPSGIGTKITGAGIDTPNLSALSGNMGTLTAGRIASPDGRMVIDLDNRYMLITT